MSNRYKLLAQQQGLQTPPTLQKIFDRAPLPNDLTYDKYTQLVSDTLTWPEVDLIEEAVITILPEGDLIEQLKATRLLYRRTVNEAEYLEYAATMSDLSATGSSTGPAYTRIRSELLAVTQRIKYVLEQEPPKEHARALLTTYNTALIVGAGLLMLLLFAPRLVLRPGQHWPFESILLVLFVGLLGGFVSVQQRLQEPTDVDPLLKWLDLKSSGYSLLLSPVIGAVFAAILMAILMGGIISSPAFPSFVCSVATRDPKCAGLDNLSRAAYATSPATAADWAKLVAWAFAAGFLERLVPDILTRIAATADVKK